MRAVNLLPRDQAPKSRVKKEQLPFVVGGCVGLVVTAILASQYLGQSGKVVAERQALTDLKAQLAALPAPPPGPTAVGGQDVVHFQIAADIRDPDQKAST